MKNLIRGINYKPTPTIERTLNLLDKYFEGLVTTVTSGDRNKQDQLRIIDGLVNKFDGLKSVYCEYVLMKGNDADLQTKVNDSGLMYWWERTYLELLKRGIKVNPPCRVFYKEQDRWVEPSPHFKGNCFDLDANEYRQEKSKRILKAKQSGKCFIRDFLVEGKQGCIHVQCDTMV